jgi:predicted enzyme related to lactoylglutathione lyase
LEAASFGGQILTATPRSVARIVNPKEATMTEQDRYIPGVPCWLDMTPPDPDAAARFYADLFGWEVEDVMPPGAPGRYLVGRIGGRDVAAIGSSPEGAAAAAAWNTYVWVESADATAERVRSAGGRVLSGPEDVGDNGRMAVCADTEGATFCLWEAGRHRGAAAVNEHGTVNFNDLYARDLEAARAFYGAVFGWTVLDLGGPGGMMWTLPGYGDFLERRSPGMLENMASMGAPEGFADVVGSLLLAEDGAARWGVTFAVDDADAIAARTAELGGRVVVPPFDAPWVRMTFLVDPQGAPFTASRFAPENKDLPQASGAATA